MALIRGWYLGYFKGMGMCIRSVVKGWGWVLEIPDLVYELEGDGHMKLLGDRSQLDLDELKVRVQYALGADWPFRPWRAFANE